MASPNHTPFIPPLGTPSAGPTPEMLTVPPPDVTPAWAREQQQQQHRTPAHYPVYPPYGTPYVNQPIIPPGSYFPPPQSLPPVVGAPGQFSADFMGYPMAGGMAGFGPHTPYHGHPATGYMAPQHLPPFGLGLHTPWGPPGAFPHTPNFGPGMTMPGAYPPNPYPPIGPYPAQPQPQQNRRPDNRPTEQGADINIQSKWFPGLHYGPVLDPFMLRVVNARLDINPILKPPPEDFHDSRDYLQWNMLFSSGRCKRRNDAEHIAWSSGRSEPATRPRLRSLRVISQQFPWMINVEAANPDIGVTCGEVIDRIDEFLHKSAPKSDFEALPANKKKEVSAAYYHNRHPNVDGVPGGRLQQGLRGVDWLCKMTSFGGITLDPDYVKRRLRVAMPDLLVLRCCMSYPEEERREERAWRESEAGSREQRRRSRSRGTPAPSVIRSLSTEESDDSDD